MARFKVRWTTDPQPDRAQWAAGSKRSAWETQRDQAVWITKLARMLKRDKMELVETDANGFMVYETRAPKRRAKVVKEARKVQEAQHGNDPR